MKLKPLFKRKALSPANKLVKINGHLRMATGKEHTLLENALTDDQINDLYERLRPRITRANIMMGVGAGGALLGGILLANTWGWNLPLVANDAMRGFLNLSQTFNVFNGKTATISVGGVAWWLSGTVIGAAAVRYNRAIDGSKYIVQQYQAALALG